LKLNSKLIINAFNRNNDDENWIRLKIKILNTLIDDFLRDKNNYKNESPVYRRLIYLELIDRNYANLEWVIRKDTDCYNRSLIFLPIFKEYVKSNIPSLIKDNCVKIRINVFDLFLRESSPEFQFYFEAALLDDNSSIRSKANYYAKKYTNFDTRSFYIERISSFSKLINCLSEFPDERDEYLFEQGLDSTNKKIVKSSLLALKKIGTLQKFKVKIIKILLNNFNLILRLEIHKIFTLEELLMLREKFEKENKIQLFFELIKSKSYWVMLDLILELIIFSQSEKFIPILLDQIRHSSRIFEKLDPILKNNILEKIEQLKSLELSNQNITTSLLFMIKYT
ncbi:hypothetical protein, partial [Leptospira kanakyensis]